MNINPNFLGPIKLNYKIMAKDKGVLTLYRIYIIFYFFGVIILKYFSLSFE